MLLDEGAQWEQIYGEEMRRKNKALGNPSGKEGDEEKAAQQSYNSPGKMWTTLGLFHVHLPIVHCSSLAISSLWWTVSNAALKSKSIKIAQSNNDMLHAAERWEKCFANIKTSS